VVHNRVATGLSYCKQADVAPKFGLEFSAFGRVNDYSLLVEWKIFAVFLQEFFVELSQRDIRMREAFKFEVQAVLNEQMDVLWSKFFFV